MSEEIKMLEKLIEENEKIFEEVGETYSLTPDVVDTIKSLISEHKELEQMVNIMAEDIAHDGFDEDVCRAYKQEDRTWECNDDENCKKCILRYYEKKAK